MVEPLLSESKEDLKEKARGRPKGLDVEVSLKKKVIQLRDRYEWGPKMVAGCLRLRGYSIDNNQACHIFCEAGLNNYISAPRKTWGIMRFQREQCNSLWQTDFKLCSDDYWMISYLDDCSRFITGSIKIWRPTGETAMLLLDRIVRRYGAPRQILTDQGTQFKPARGGKSAFDIHCTELGVEPFTVSVPRPNTCGKIEAFHKAYELESHLFQGALEFHMLL